MNIRIKRTLFLLVAVILVINLPISVIATSSNIGTNEPAADSTQQAEGEDVNSPRETNVAEADSLIATTTTTTTDLFFWNLSKPNYTVTLSSQVEVRYRISEEDELQTAWIKILGWHYSLDPNHPLYCLEPSKDYGESTSYNAVDEGVSLYGNADTYGSSVWFSLPEKTRYAIGLILLHSETNWDYSYDVKLTEKADNPNVALRMVTQFLLWEIITGLRDPVSFIRKDSNGYTDGDVFYNAGVTDIPNFEAVYEALVSEIEKELTIPSFSGQDPQNAPVINLYSNVTTEIDHNGVLAEFTFSESEGVRFTKDGNELTITQVGPISSDEVFSCVRETLSPITSTYSIWYSPYISDYQTCITLHTEDYSIVEAYFRLEAASGDMRLQKTMPDGGNVSGWEFEVYRVSDDSFIGNFISGEDGTILVDQLHPGDYRIVEKIPDNSIYYCEAANPKTVTVAAGQTAEVTFTNRLKPAEISIQKVDTTGNPLAGAIFLLEWSVDGVNWSPVTYTDSPYVTEGTCTTVDLLEGCLTSPVDGIVRFTGLHPERYYRLSEISAPDGYQLLAGAAFEGTIPIDKSLTMTLTVVNTPVYELPMTGSKSFVVMAVSLYICIAGCVGMLVYLRRKEQ